MYSSCSIFTTYEGKKISLSDLKKNLKIQVSLQQIRRWYHEKGGPEEVLKEQMPASWFLKTKPKPVTLDGKDSTVPLIAKEVKKSEPTVWAKIKKYGRNLTTEMFKKQKVESKPGRIFVAVTKEERRRLDSIPGAGTWERENL